MKGRRSSRSAAVVLAGCVGLAVMAPGLALAAPVVGVTTEAECEALGYTWTDGVCDDGVTAQPDATLDGTGTGTGSGTGSTSTETSDESRRVGRLDRRWVDGRPPRNPRGPRAVG